MVVGVAEAEGTRLLSVLFVKSPDTFFIRCFDGHYVTAFLIDAFRERSFHSIATVKAGPAAALGASCLYSQFR